MTKKEIRTRRRKKSLGLSFFLVALPISLIIALLLFTLLLFLVFRSSYNGWERKFEDSHLSTDIVKVEKKILEDIKTQIKGFQESEKETDFVEISSTDFASLLALQINENLPSRMEIVNSFSETRKGFWMLYYKLDIKGVGEVWIYFDLNKDEVESTDLYVTDVKIGNISVRDLGGESIVENINNGIKESMILITQKDFTGRIIRNIELDEDTIIIKGEK